ncbi:MAG: hypothetical protein QXM92_01750 [Candidatus Anstonellales archaeon]
MTADSADSDFELERKAALANIAMFALFSTNPKLRNNEKSELGAAVVKVCAQLWNVDVHELVQLMKEQAYEGLELASYITKRINKQYTNRNEESSN